MDDIENKNEWKQEYINEYLRMENGFDNNVKDKAKDVKREEFLVKWSDKIPKLFYHYMPFSQKHHVKSFVESKLWFSYPNYYNDPNDSRVIVDFKGDISKIKLLDCLDYFERSYEFLNKKIQAAQMDMLDLSERLIDYRCGVGTRLKHYFLEKLLTKQYLLRKVLGEAIDELKNKGEKADKSALYNKYKKCAVESMLEAYDKEIAVCSFSALNNNMLMWTHYADQHRGICIAYRSEDLIKNSLGFMFPMVYNHPAFYDDLLNYDKPVFGLFDCRDYYIRRFLFKSQEWEYEKEWRALLDTAENCATFNADTRGFLSPKLQPASVYVGNNMAEDDKEFIKIQCESKGISCYQMRIKNDSWQFDTSVKL